MGSEVSVDKTLTIQADMIDIAMKLKKYFITGLLGIFLSLEVSSREIISIDNPTEKCQFSKLEADFMKILKNDRRQKRASVTCHPLLLKLARARAKDMAVRRYFSHTNPDGYGPNYLLQQLGYKLPEWWGKGKAANYIESISAGRSTAQAAYTGWMNSTGHRTHVLAQKNFYANQTNVAIGHYYDSSTKYGHYWVFISAPPE